MARPMKFTVGMPCFDDFTEVWCTVQMLWSFHSKWLHEVVVVHNNPGTKKGQRMQTLAGRAMRTRYVPFNEVVGTAAAKNKVFESASGEYVVCMDSHCIPQPGFFESMVEFYHAAEGDPVKLNSLLSGPLLHDDHKGMSTHLNDTWGSGLRGQWAKATGEQISAPWFEIQNMGTGLMACRKEAWLGFNPAFRGFGGEEWYIQTKFRKAGRKVFCVNGMKWLHMFGDQTEPKPFPNSMFDRARNYFIGHTELGEDVESCRAHFVSEKLITQDHWNQIVEGKDKPCATCGTGTAPAGSLAEWHGMNCKQTGDLNEHLPVMAELAKGANVVDCGDRQHYTVPAFAAGGASRIVSVGGSKFRGFDGLASFFPKLTFAEGSSLTVPEEKFADCDLLFLDTEPHNADHVFAELMRLEKFCRHYIVLHDTVSFGEKGQLDRPGIMGGVRLFLHQHQRWTVVKHYRNNNGLLVLSCRKEDKKKLPNMAKRAWNFARAAADHLANGRPVTPEAEFNARVDECMTCESRTDGHCAECGCPIEDKASWAGSDCPLNFWPRKPLPLVKS